MSGEDSSELLKLLQEMKQQMADLQGKVGLMQCLVMFTLFEETSAEEGKNLTGNLVDSIFR